MITQVDPTVELLALGEALHGSERQGVRAREICAAWAANLINLLLTHLPYSVSLVRPGRQRKEPGAERLGRFKQ